jgi:predicted transcriptional regulator
MTLRTRDRVPTNLTLPADLVAQVDAIAGARGRSRFIEEATRLAIRREQLRAMHASVAGALKADEYPRWATSDAVVAWVRESRAEELQDQGDGPTA